MPLHTIKAPVPFTGVGPGGLKFRTGRAQTEDEDLVGWFRAAGYIIDGLPPVSEAVGSLAPPWAPDTAYDAGELVWRDGLLHRRKVAGTDGATFDPTGWDTPGSATSASAFTWTGSSYGPAAEVARTAPATFIGPTDPATIPAVAARLTKYDSWRRTAS